jgi:pSer/pThr/pTyr-binding forkhead associated (FHA) protein
MAMARDRKTDKPGEPRRLALKFISGKYQGGEFPLNEGQDVVVGRSSELDMVLVEEMVSRKHAVFRFESGVLTVQDLGSTNGTFVNGERIDKAVLREGDRVLVGTSILRVIGFDASQPPPVRKGLMGETQKHIGPHPMNEPPESAEPPRMSGNLEEIPLPDLMQLFSTSKKTGVLVLRTPDRIGRLHLDAGRIRFAEVDTNPALPPEKAVYRLLSFTRGLFSLDPPENRGFPKSLDLSATEVLMEGFRQQDEINALGDKVPAPRTPLVVPKQPPGRLRDLSPEELDWLELALRGRTLEGALDLSVHSDLDTVRALMGLFSKGWLATG